MMLSIEDVAKIAKLACINLEASELQELQPQLRNILNMIEAMDKVDTSNIMPMAHPLGSTQRLREDIVTETNQRELFQSIAPKTEQDLYLVPQVIEE